MAESFAWFLALRYLLTRGIHFVALFGVAVAVWALIVVISVFSGMIAEIHEHVRAASAELLVQGLPAGTSFERVRGVIEADPEVEACAPRLSQVGIYFTRASAQRGTRPQPMLEQRPTDYNFVVFVGVDPDREAATTGFREWLVGVKNPELRVEQRDLPFRVSGERIDDADALLGIDRHGWESEVESLRTVVFSELRMRSTSQWLQPGERIDVVGGHFGTHTGTPELEKFRFWLRVAGAFATEHKAVDMAYAFVPIATLRKALGYDEDALGAPDRALDVVTEVAIKARPGVALEALATRLGGALPRELGARVSTWERQNETYLDAVRHERAMMKVVLFLVMLVAAFLIYAMLHMLVMQKWRDIGILTALGATPRGIATIFLLCGGLVAAGGSTLGVVLGVISARSLNDANLWARTHLGIELFPRTIYTIDSIPYRLDAQWIAEVVALAMALALLVAWLPARRAARMPPVQALTHV